MKILADDNMPFAAEFFADWSAFSTFSSSSLSPEDLRDVDVLLVRSTSRVDEALLERASTLKFVGTATSGSNHVDTDLLQRKGIAFASARGCNANAVAEYVVCAMLESAERHDWDVFNRSVGIVGAGNVGTALGQKLSAMGIRHLFCDPPLARSGDPRQFVDMATILTCDTISLHVPLIDQGTHPTRHLLGLDALCRLQDHQLLINACRGEVVDNQGLLALLRQGKPINAVLDVWDGEPDILWPLVEYVDIATPHIAGHSLEGKARGTSMLYDALCDYLAVPKSKTLKDYLPPMTAHNSGLQRLGALSDRQAQQAWLTLCRYFYDIIDDDQSFRRNVTDPVSFAHSRSHYGIRREFDAAPLNAGKLLDSQALYAFGFRPR